MSTTERKLGGYYEEFIAASEAAARAHEGKLLLEGEVRPKLMAAQQAVDNAERTAWSRRGELYATAFLLGVINEDVIDVLAPIHQTVDCDEADPEKKEERCVRCFLRYALKNQWRLADVELSIAVKWEKP